MDEMDLWDAAGVGAGSVVSVIGAGGKTTTIFTLAGQSERRGLATLVTTTTKMRRPDLPLLLTEDEKDLDSALRRGFQHHHLLAAGRAVSDADKLLSLDPDVICSLRAPEVVLCEADGAAGRSLKIHRPGEPVVPACSTHLFVLVGLDAVGRSISEAAHPPAVAAQHFGAAEDAPIVEHQIFEALMEGTRYAPEGTRIIQVLNKADTEERAAMGRRIAGVARMLNPTAVSLLTSYGHVVERIDPLSEFRPYTRP